jgi:hypothetical protein
MTAHALLSHQPIRRKRERGSHPELDEAAAAGIHGFKEKANRFTFVKLAILARP